MIKLKYSLLTSSFIQCCNEYVIIYSGASVSEFIRAIRSFISIDISLNLFSIYRIPVKCCVICRNAERTFVLTTMYWNTYAKFN